MMNEKERTLEKERKTRAWILRLGGLALAATGVVVGLKTKDFGAFAGFWMGGVAAGASGEIIADLARESDPTFS